MTDQLFEQIWTTLWVSGGKPDRRLARTHGYAYADVETAFQAELERRRAIGEIAEETSPTGERLLVYRPDLTGTLRDVAEPYLTDSEAPEWSQKMLKGALRFQLGLPRTYPLGDLLDACERVSLREVHSLPEAVYEAGTAIGKKKRSAPSWKSALRAAMEWVARREALPLAFPCEWCAGIENDVTHRLVEALADVWVSGREPSHAALAEMGGPNPGSIQRRLQEWEAEGRAAFQPHQKRGRTLLWVDLGRVGAEEATLADAVRAYLEAPETNGGPSRRQMRALMRALRAHFGLQYASRDQVIEASAHVPAAHLHGWADDLQERYVADLRHTRKEARTMASAVRVALRWTAGRQRIPMIFGDRTDDPWQVAKTTWIPSTRGTIAGASRGTRYGYRTCWGEFEQAVRGLYGPEVTPEMITPEMADAALVWHKERGRYDRARAISGALNWLGRRGLGPRAGCKPVLQGDPLLKGEDGCGCATYDRFLAALDYHGLPSEWREFFEWYGEYSLWPEEELRRARAPDGSRRFPERAEIRRLNPKTLAVRIRAARWVLGITRNVLGVDLSTLRLEDAFGAAHLERVIDAGREMWQVRYRMDLLSSPYGTSLRHYVQGAGLLAEALYSRSRHRRGKQIAIDGDSRRNVGVDAVEEEAAEKSAAEASLWQAYRHTVHINGVLTARARDFGSAEGANTQKDLAEILRLTPPDWYWRVFSASLELARRSLESDGESEEHHRLVRDVYTFGFLLSTGMRGDELGHVRLDLQYPDHERAGMGPRMVRLHRRDRKNGRGHNCVVQEPFVPRWLEDAYLRQSRPWLMRHLRPTERRWELSRDEMHQHLIVDNAGRALGCVEEREDRSGRKGQAMEPRINGFRDRWKNRFGRIAWDHCGLTCPAQDGYFTLHTIRNVMGHFHFQEAARVGDEHPALRAANYLGDDPAQVLKAYATLDASRVEGPIGEQMRAWSEPASRPARADLPPDESPQQAGSLFARLQGARAEVYREGGEWGLDTEEIEQVWADRRKRIMDEHERRSDAA